MSRYDVAFLTIRGFAIFAWFQALEYFAGGTMSVFFQASLRWSFAQSVAIFVPSLIFLGAGIFLFAYSRRLASRLLQVAEDAAIEPFPPHPLAAASVAFAVVGALIFLLAAPRLITLGLKVVTSEPDSRSQLAGQAPQIIPNAIQVVGGLLLFIKSKALATAWWRKQKPSLRDENSSDAARI